MSDIHRLPEKEMTLREATQWVARLHADDVSDADRQRFETWRNAHPLHARTYDEVAATWNLLLAAGPAVRKISAPQDMHALVRAAAPWRGCRWLAAAAAVAFVCVGSWFALTRTAAVEYRTAVGQHSVMQLEDGSTMELNTNSVARVEYASDARIIRLERGEAFLQVAHDSARPFWVVADGAWVRAVGTAFGVHQRNDGLHVVVSEGVVKVGYAKEGQLGAPALGRSTATVVSAGQQARIADDRTIVESISGEQVLRTLAWRKGSITFDDEPLSTVVAELSRYTTLQLVLDDEAVSEMRIGGTFKASNAGVESFLAMLQDGLGLRVLRESDRVHIAPGDEQTR